MSIAFALPLPRMDTLFSEPTRTAVRTVDPSRTDPRLAATKTETSDRALRDLFNTYLECRTPDWDGHGALPVSLETLEMTLRVLEVLPPGLPRPTFGAEPDGELTMEWYRSPRRLLSLSIGNAGDLNYAALLGAERIFGRILFCGAIPDNLIALIRKVSTK